MNLALKRPMLYMVLPLSAGIAAAFYFNIPVITSFIACAVSVSLVLFFFGKKNLPNLFLCLALFFLGTAWYANSITLPQSHIKNLLSTEPERVFLKGVIISDPVIAQTPYKTEKTSFIVNAQNIKKNAGWTAVTGPVKVDSYVSPEKPFSAGDRVILEGLLYGPAGLRNPGIFDYSRYLGIKGIYAFLKVGKGCLAGYTEKGRWDLIRSAAFKVRNKIKGVIDRYLPPPYGGFLTAILVGERNDLARAITDDFIKTGTVHILAISGLNICMIAAIFMAIFGVAGIPKKANFILTAALLVFYSLVAGANPPIIRATVIFCIFVAGYVMNRDADILNSLACAALLILLWNPGELFDPSFQLSFVSVASIVIIAPKIDSLLKTDVIRKNFAPARVIVYALNGISVSIAAWIGTWPFIAAYFNIVSPVSIIANLFIIPMLFLITVLSFIFLAAAAAPGFPALITAAALSASEKFLFWMNHAFSLWPFAYFRISAPSPILALLYYGTLLALISPVPGKLAKFKISKTTILIIFLLFLNLIVWPGLLGHDRKDLRITFLDVGQGDSAFIEFPHSGNMLIDAGSGGEEERLDAARAVVAPYLWNNKVGMIDMLVVTHFHEDHLGGILYILKNFRVGCVIDSGMPAQDNRIYDEYMRIIRENGIKHLSVRRGDVIGPVNGVKIFVLNPDDNRNIPAEPAKIGTENESSIVLKIAYRNFNALLCGDITDKVMSRLSELYDREFLQSDVIKVPHHGGIFKDREAVERFFWLVSPKVSIISVANMNRYNAPSKATLDIINHLNSKRYETRKNGAIIISSDGNDFKEKVYINKN